MSFFLDYENGWASGSEYSGVPLPDFRDIVARTALSRFATTNLNCIPVFVRKFLSPNARNDRTIASLSNVDRLLSEFDTEETDWKIYWSACEKLFQDATGLTFREMNYADKLKSLS